MKTFSENGVLLQEGFYVKGKESGLWKFYDKDGNIEFSGDYKDGERIGEWFEFDKKGRKKLWKY